MKRIKRLIKRHYKLIIFCALVVLVLILNQVFGWSNYLSDSGKLAFLSDMVENNMFAASLIYIGLTIVSCVVLALPGVVFAILAGAIFGPWYGTLLCLIATTIGAIASFIAGRFFLQDSIKPMLEKNKKLKKLLFDDIGRSDIALLAITRLVPIFPYNLQNFAYGVTEMSLIHYSIYTFLFMIPGVALYTFGVAGLTSNTNKGLYFAIAGGLLVLTLLLAWLLKKKSERVKISIILAVYNGENDVARCIESLRNQTHKDIEIICVDDGSTDGTLAILKEQAAKDSRIKVLEQGENKKLLLAIKRGVKEATGDYIMFIDDDDWYEPNACEKVVEIIKSDNPDAVVFGTNLVEINGNQNLKIKEKREKILRVSNFKYKGENALGLKKFNYIYIWDKAVRTEIVKKAYNAIPDVEMTYRSDSFACMLMFYYVKTVVGTSDELINYNYNSGTTAVATISAETYEYILRCRKIYEEGVAKFLEENNAEVELQNFRKGYERRVKGLINTLNERVSKEEYQTAYNILVKYCDEALVKALMKEEK